MTIPTDCALVEPCCEGLYGAASDLAQAVAAALAACQPEGSCDDLDAFVSHHRPIGPGHYVGVWLVRQRFTTGRVNLALPSPTFAVRYVEPGYPRLGPKGTAPARADIDKASRHTYAHLAVMIDAVRATTLSITRNAVCNVVTVDRAEPDPPQTGFVGWTLEATWGYGLP